MVNADENQYESFPNMFQANKNADVLCGDVIAIKDGYADSSFFERCCDAEYLTEQFEDPEYEYTMYNGLHAHKSESIADLKARIIRLSKEPDGVFVKKPDNYLAATDIFVSDDEKAVLEYVTGEGNYFRQEISVSDYSVYISFTRVINGFSASERIEITHFTTDDLSGIELDAGSSTENSIIRSGEAYTRDDLAAVPNISAVIASLDLSTLEAPHTTVEGLTRRHVTVTGCYYKVGGKVYGLVKVLWTLTDSQWQVLYRDDMYTLADADGKCRVVERDELKEVLGDSISGLYRFEYNTGEYVPMY